jgi:O-antigen/teichoic acid export membrane protein
MHSRLSATANFRLGSEILTYAPSTFVPAVTGFLVVIVLARILPPEGYGVVALAGATVAILEALAFGWLSNAILRFLPDAIHTHTAAALLRRCAAYAALSAALAAGLTFPIVMQTFGDGRRSIVPLLASGLVATVGIGDVALASLRSFGASRLYAAGASLRAAMRLAGLTVGALSTTDRVTGALAGWLVGWLISTLAIAGASVSRAPRHEPTRQPTPGWRQLATYGFPVSASLVLGVVLSDGDRYLLQFLAGDRQVGLYSVVYQIANGSLAVLYPLPMAAAYPRIVMLWDDPAGRARALEILAEAARHFLALAAPAAAGLVALSKPLLAVLTTHAYAGAAPAMVPIVAGVFVLGAGQYATIGLLLNKQPLRLTGMLGASAVANVLLNLALIPRFGSVGAGVATLGAYSLYAGLGFWFSRRIAPLHVDWLSASRILGSATLMAIVVWSLGRVTPPTPLGVGLVVAVGAATYGALLLVTREVRPWH